LFLTTPIALFLTTPIALLLTTPIALYNRVAAVVKHSCRADNNCMLVCPHSFQSVLPPPPSTPPPHSYPLTLTYESFLSPTCIHSSTTG
jgi:hypothetical protein